MVLAQADLPIYTDHLVNGFQDWSWAPHNFANTAPVHSGSNSISVNATAYQAIWLEHPGFNPGPYSNLVFWANGGAAGGQRLQVRAVVNGNAGATFAAAPLTAGLWRQLSVPLSKLGLAGQTNIEGFWIILGPGASGGFYLDDVVLAAAPAPPLVHVVVHSAPVIRTVDARMFGLNTAVWDSSLDTPESLSLLRDARCSILRFPGGSLSDDYHWASNTTDANKWTWATSFKQFASVATNLGAQTFITVNYGTGSPAEAAAWVRSANVTNHYGFKYWEIGNEVYGLWETDSNSLPHHAFTYAGRAAEYFAQMKAVDPSIKIGVVAVPGATNSVNGYTNHPALNLRTGQTNYGWTPVLLATLRNLGVTPDFLVYHFYPEYTGQESDALVLQASTQWAAAAADLRQQIADYFGPGGANIELVCTENNSQSGAQGRQSTSLVNALYLADSFGSILATEFNAWVWWDLRNGSDATGNMDPTLYGWRTNGDLGMVTGRTNCYPDYYAMKLMGDFAWPGDGVIGASSDYPLLSAYAVLRTNGSMGLLVLNKDVQSSFSAQISLVGFVPASNALLYSYGKPQDDAARTGVGSQDIAMTNTPFASSNIVMTFPPLSLTLLNLAPPPPLLVPSGGINRAGQIPALLQGQPGASYVVEVSTNLSDWLPYTSYAVGSLPLNIFFPVSPGPGSQFWRARWAR